MNTSFNKLLLIGVALEFLILIGCYLLHPEWEETFQYAARYSGRLSAVVFLYTFYSYAMTFPLVLGKNLKVRHFIKLFAVLHVIHFAFLALNIYLNDIQLVPVKLLGGALAYLMIVVAPFILHRLKRPFQLLYFYYVALVMTITYVARVQGDFEGAQPYWLHDAMLVIFLVAMIGFALRMWKAKT